MPKVLCTRPNAGEEISGVKFSLHKDQDGHPVGMISENITAAQAEHFLEVPGYELVDDAPKKAAEPAPAAKPAAQKPSVDKGAAKADKAAATAAQAAAEKAAADAAAAAANVAQKPPVDVVAPAVTDADNKAPDPEETF